MSYKTGKCKQCNHLGFITPEELCLICINRIMRCRIKKMAQNALEKKDCFGFKQGLDEIIRFLDDSVVKEE